MPRQLPIPPVLRFAIHGAQDTKCIQHCRRPLRGLEKMPTQRLNKKKSTRFHGCFSFCLTGNYLSSQAASSQVLSTYGGLTTVFGMGTGGSPQLSPPDDDCAYYLGANLFATLIIVPQANAFFRPSRRKNTNRHLEGRNPQNFTEEKTNDLV